MRKTVMLAMLENSSAAERMKAVHFARELAAPDEAVLNALVRTVNDDPNVNVRLTAVESSGAGTIDGLWVATVSDSQVKFRLTVLGEGDKDEWNASLPVARDRLSGLEFGKDHSFKITGDAGTITFTGKLSGTRGSGSFTFVADSGFVSFLEGKKLGRIDDKHLFFLLTGNIDKAYIQELERLGYSDVSSSRLVELAIHRVSLDYIKEMQAFGWQNLTLSKVVEFKIHGIDKDYIQYCRDLLKGKKELTPELVVKMKINGI